jgi:DNA-binding transcriptional ArsR family regulator
MTENMIAAGLALGRSSIRWRILDVLMAQPELRLHLREIQRRARTSPGTASRELGRLVSAGLVEREAEGNQVYFRLDTSPFALAFLALVATPATPISPAFPIREGRRPDTLGLQVANRLAEMLRPLYADRLIGIFLYGSRARGESRPDADVEVAVVLESVPRYGDELERTSSICAHLSLEYGVIVSRVFISEDTWTTRTDGQLQAIRTEAVAV